MTKWEELPIGRCSLAYSRCGRVKVLYSFTDKLTDMCVFAWLISEFSGVDKTIISFYFPLFKINLSLLKMLKCLSVCLLNILLKWFATTKAFFNICLNLNQNSFAWPANSLSEAN